MPNRPRPGLFLWFLLLPLLWTGSLAVLAQSPAPPPIIDVKTVGTGKPALVFIPGLATPGSIWDETVAAFAKTNTCYVVTVAGFGGQPPVAPREHFLVDVREALIGWLRSHAVDHPVIIGHSLGGALALDLTEHAPELPASLVLVDTLPFLAALLSRGVRTEADARAVADSSGQKLSSLNPAQFRENQQQTAVRQVTDPIKAAAIATLTGRSDPATVGQALTERLSRDLRPKLSGITCPVLVLGALADKVGPDMPHEAVEKIFRDQFAGMPQARFEFFDKARHYIMIDDPAGFQAVLRKEVASPLTR